MELDLILTYFLKLTQMPARKYYVQIGQMEALTVNLIQLIPDLGF